MKNQNWAKFEEVISNVEALIKIVENPENLSFDYIILSQTEHA
jgi:hypothetical protein